MPSKVIPIYRCEMCEHEWASETMPTHCPECLEMGPYIFERVGWLEI